MDFALPTGQTLAVDRRRPANAPMVVLLHGVSGNRRGYGVLIDHLIGRVERCDLQVINVDLRGHGQSSRATLATYDAPSYATGIAALIDSLTDRGAIMVGHSLGGLSLRRWRRRGPTWFGRRRARPPRKGGAAQRLRNPRSHPCRTGRGGSAWRQPEPLGLSCMQAAIDGSATDPMYRRATTVSSPT